MTRPPFVIGVISDTHGMLPDSALEAFADVDAIVHAGDVGDGFVLDLLEGIARVIAVRGNNRYASEARLPIVANVKLGGVRVIVAHRASDLTGAFDPVVAGVAVAVHGHSHVPEIEVCDGVLWVNPGSPSSPHAGSPASVALVTVSDGGLVTARLVTLP